MDKIKLKKLELIFNAHPEIKLVYFFGSQATGKKGALSDYDFAFYLDDANEKKMLKIKFILMDKISRILKTDKVDIVILNFLKSPELKYQIIKDGILIFKKEPFKILVEPRVLNEYYDFHQLLLKYNLTKAK